MKIQLVRCKIPWLAKKNTRQRITLNEYNRLPTTRDTVRHEKLLRVRCINGDLPHGFSHGLRDKYVLTSHTIFLRFKVRLKMLVSEFRRGFPGVNFVRAPVAHRLLGFRKMTPGRPLAHFGWPWPRERRTKFAVNRDHFPTDRR